ncbi:MAG TPA: SGNH/GDSL hydrolase family protein, partial [Actinomycetota bacterium]|nr:SGNH/GDSL hydrolase family protein [Actinomycetota bacterium]
GGGGMRLRSVVLGTCLFLLGPVIAAGNPAAAQTALPTRMASIGDSITTAVNVCCWYGARPAHSWSTGWNTNDPVRSHYERILAVQPAIAGRNYNDARGGARMADAPGQAARAVAQQAQYVTILMGANDVCTSSPSTMTPVADFRTSFQTAMATLSTGLPNAEIFVSSIPNVHRLWRIFRYNLAAQTAWYVAKTCQSMLSPFRTKEGRQRVLTRERAFNDVLAQVCAQYAQCRFDGHAVFNFPLEPGHVSKLDYFHPNKNGQAVLASLTWARSWWSVA